MNDKILPLLSMAFFFLCIIYSILSPYLAPTINSNLHSYILISIAIILITLGMVLKMMMNFSKQRTLGFDSNGLPTTSKKSILDYVYLFGRLLMYILIIGMSGVMIFYSSKYYNDVLHNISDHSYLNYLNYWIYVFLVLIYIVLNLKFFKTFLKSNVMNGASSSLNLANVNWTSHLRIGTIWTMFMIILYSFELNKFSDDNSYDMVNN
tara:strand:- start:69 stop:692 length:624 start_codon:yes stop_codon:yes gene_type:complete